MNLRRYFRNRLKSAIKDLNALEDQSSKTPSNRKLADQVLLAREEEAHLRHVSKTLDTLISWLEHDILNKAGPMPDERRALYDFVVEEFKKLERIETHRIVAMRITLENKRKMALAFADALDEKFKLISQQFNVPVDTVWTVCKLQRCAIDSDQYAMRSVPLQLELDDRFDEIEDAVMLAMDETERTSSMIENLNGRVRKYIRNRREIGHGYLDLLRFFLNHKPILRSARTDRQGKTPAEVLSGTPHPHWLELLGFERFKHAA